VEHISLKIGRLLDISMFHSLLGIHWIPVIYTLRFPHEILILILQFSFQSTFQYMLFSLCSETRRSKLLGIHLCSQSDNRSSIILLGCVCDDVLFTDLLLCCHGGWLDGFNFPEAVSIVLQNVVFSEQKCMLRVMLFSSSSANLMSLGIFQVFMYNLLDGVVPVM